MNEAREEREKEKKKKEKIFLEGEDRGGHRSPARGRVAA
jgi:hypothetical protein